MYVANCHTNKPIFTGFLYVLAQVVPGALVLLISYLGCRIELILVVWFVAITLITAAYAGAMANVVDIAPNFAGPVLAFAQTIHMTASFLSPLAAGYILRDQVGFFDGLSCFNRNNSVFLSSSYNH